MRAEGACQSYAVDSGERGKSTWARQLVEKLGAVNLRIDTIERAIADGDEAGSIDDGGYRVAYSFAEDNLYLGRTVIGDPVNPRQIGVAERAAKGGGNKVICSDLREHRRRIETRDGRLIDHKDG